MVLAAAICTLVSTRVYTSCGGHDIHPIHHALYLNMHANAFQSCSCALHSRTVRMIAALLL